MVLTTFHSERFYERDILFALEFRCQSMATQFIMASDLWIGRESCWEIWEWRIKFCRQLEMWNWIGASPFSSVQ